MLFARLISPAGNARGRNQNGSGENVRLGLAGTTHPGPDEEAGPDVKPADLSRTGVFRAGMGGRPCARSRGCVRKPHGDQYCERKATHHEMGQLPRGRPAPHCLPLPRLGRHAYSGFSSRNFQRSSSRFHNFKSTFPEGFFRDVKWEISCNFL